MVVKPEWLERVKATHTFHINRIRQDPAWTIAQTAKLLKRGIGPVSEDLKVAEWLKSHGTKLEGFKYFSEAIEWIRVRKHKLLLGDLDA